jgi:hypothetical protein
METLRNYALIAALAIFGINAALILSTLLPERFNPLLRWKLRHQDEDDRRW